MNRYTIPAVIIYLLIMVGAPGFEPGLKRPKRLVLPLHYAPFTWSPRRESDPHQDLRRVLLYPLSYEGILK